MQTTRRELLDDFLDYVGEAQDVLARNVAERVLNRAVETIWLTHPWKAFMSPNPIQITLVPNQRSYALPERFGRIGPGRIKNLTTGGRLGPLTAEQLDDRHPTAGTSYEIASRPTNYLIAGRTGVATQPPPPSAGLHVTSDHPGDADPATAITIPGVTYARVLVTIIGLDDTGRKRSAEYELHGTDLVYADGWQWIDSFSKQHPFGVEPIRELYSSQGQVRIQTAVPPLPPTSPVVLQTLGPAETAQMHDVITFYPKPSHADTIVIPFMHKIDRLTRDADPIPDHWGPAVFEQMLRSWRVNTGEASEESAAAGPRFLDLVALDNGNLHGVPLQTRPWRG